MNFTDPIAEIPHPHLMTSPVSEVLIFYCAFFTLYITTVTTFIFQSLIWQCFTVLRVQYAKHLANVPLITSKQA